MHRQSTARGIIEADLRQIAEVLGDRADVLAGTTLLLTGAGGLLAAYLAESIAWWNEHRFSRPCQLIAMVRSEGGRLRHLRDRRDVTFLKQDAREPIEIHGELDFVIHAASNASPRAYLADPLDTIDANTMATRRILDLAKEKHCRSALFFSSAEIYGDVPCEHSPTREDYLGTHATTSPRACYTESKRFGEMLCATYWRQFQMPVKIVRPFHVYGPGMRLDDGRVVADFLRDRGENRPIRVLGDGSAVRTFCYLADATVGFWLALFSPHHGEAFNMGDDREIVSILELAKMVAAIDGAPTPVQVEAASKPDYARDSPSRAYPDLTKARTQLGYQPSTNLRDGLTRTWRSVRPAIGALR